MAIETVPDGGTPVRYDTSHPKVREAGLFLRALFSHYPIGCGFIEIRTLPHTKNSRHPVGVGRHWFPVETVQSASSLLPMAIHCVSSAEDYDVYVGVLPRREKGFAKQEDIRAAGVCWADLDVKNGMDDSLCLQSAHEADILVKSGTGWHGYWLSKSIIPIDETTGPRFRQKLMAFQRQHRAVDNTANLDRILRVPGTFNWKNADEPLPVRLVRYPR